MAPPLTLLNSEVSTEIRQVVSNVLTTPLLVRSCQFFSV